MPLVKCRECGSFLSSLSQSCPDCGALRPGVHFDAGSPATQRLYLTVRNGVLFRIFTPWVLLSVLGVTSVGLLVYLVTRPTPAQLVARTRRLADSATAARRRGILSSIKTDVQHMEVAEERYFADSARYGSFDDLHAAGATLSAGNTMTITTATNGYTITAGNPAVGPGISPCTVQVAAGATADVDGLVVCGNAKARPE